MNVRKFARPVLAGVTIASYLTAAVPAMAAQQLICFATADGAKYFRISADFAITGVGTSLPVTGVDYLASFSPGCAGVQEWPITGSIIVVNSSEFILGFHEFSIDSVSTGGCGGTEYFVSAQGTSPYKPYASASGDINIL